MIITTDNEVFQDTIFAGNPATSWNPPYSTDKQCIVKGVNIPIYRIWEDFYKSDFDNGNGYGGYYRYSVNGRTVYKCGRVIALSNEPKNGYIGALVVQKADTTYRTQSERIAEINNQQYTNTSVIEVDFLIAPYNENNDYTKFIYTGGNSSAWVLSRGASALIGTTLIIMGVVGWKDGTGTSLGSTLCFPFIVESTNDKWNNLYGISGRVLTQSSLFPFGNFDNIVVSENPSEQVGFGRNYALIGESADGTFSGFNFITDFYSGFEPPSDKPFEDDYNEGGGGEGDYKDTSDTIPVDGTPTNSAIASGFVNAYLLTQQNVNDFHAYLYSTDFLTNVKKLMNDPIDYILAFMLAPYTPDTSAAVNITIGGTDSEVAAMRISSGYKTVDCGTITLKEFWGKFYDYNPYTKIQIYLPFIGMRPLDVDDVMAGDVNLKYRIDVLTGACVATVSVNNARGTNGAVYTFNGNCHSHIPVSGKNYLETVTNVISAGVGMAGSIASGNALGVATGAINVMRSAKEQLEHAGELTGVAGLLANYTPFLMVSRPSQSLAQNYNHYKGFISNVTKTLGELSGYTEVAELVQTNIHCTLDEFDEINELLKEGVYL